MPKGYDRDVKSTSEMPPPPRAMQAPSRGPVEGQAWFQRLSPAARDEFRARWRGADALDAKREGFAQTSLQRSIAQATLVFFFNETVCAVPSVWHSLAAIVAGVAVGCWWHRIGSGRFQCITTSIAPFVAMRIAFAIADNSVGLAASCIFGVLGFVTLISLMALVGLVRERRRADDEDH